MKLFFYYALHSVKNQIRKLCKSWFIGILVACILFGGIIGYLAATIDESTGNDELVSEVEEIAEEEEISIVLPEKMEMAELIATAIIVVIILLNLMNVEKTGLAIFQPADVGILFASPMKPASVMMFRTFCTMGLSVFFTVYYMIEVPALMEMLEISAFGAACMIVAVGITVIMASFIKILISIETTLSEKFKKNWTYVLYGIIGFVAVMFLVNWKNSGLEVLDAAVQFFNTDISRFVPIVGWIKGIAFYGIEGNIGMLITELVLCIGTIALLLMVIYRSNPDYYEEAIHKSEELAELTRAARENNKLFARKKSDKEIDLSEKLMKDKMNFGSGALMFFIKPLYNRVRFAKFKVFTKTLITYTLVAALSCFIDNMLNLDMPIYIPMFIIAAFVFYRSFGNPLKEDFDTIYFRMSPHPGWKKLLASLLAGEANCLLDMLPAVIILGIYTGTDFLSMLGFVAFILTLDFFSTCSGTFVNISLPENAGATVKQTMQIMFIYFGILPDALVIVLCLIADWDLVSVLLLASLINMVVGAVFLGLSVPYLDPRGGECHFEGKKEYLLEGRKSYTIAGIALCVFYALTILFSRLLARLFVEAGITVLYGNIWYYVLAMAPMYAIGMPAALLVMKKVKEKIPEKRKLELSLLLKAIPVIALFMITGSLTGNLLTMFFTELFQGTYSNPVVELLSESNFVLQIIFIVLFGPFMEELLFRKILINKLSPYGQRMAVLVSAILFGLFHGNLSQLFYAFGLGLVLGYIYIRTGSLKTTFIIHAVFNLLNGVLLNRLVTSLDFEVLSGVANIAAMPIKFKVYFGYLILEIILAIIGIVILCSEMRNLKFTEEEKELPYAGRIRNSLLAPGICAFAVLIIGYIVYCFMML